MSRRLVALFVILCTCWQSLAYAGAGVTVTEAREHLHELLHFERAAHHHDDHDGSVHRDESTDSVKHVVADAGQFAPALTTWLTLAVPQLQPVRPHATGTTAHPIPFLLGLERPPRLTA